MKDPNKYPVQMIEYMEMDTQLAIMDYIKRKTRREAEQKQKFTKNPIWKIVCFCGIV